MASIYCNKEIKISKEYFGHPRELFILSFVEMWERFSFYGLRSLLIIYMSSFVFFEFPERVYGFYFLSFFYSSRSAVGYSSFVYGIYSGLIYLTPIFGGFIADRLIDRRKVVIAGGVFIALGHLLITDHAWFLWALFLIIIGTGGLKGNIAAQVGDLYDINDKRRERGFSLYYFSINIGAAISPVICMIFVQKWGWTIAFDATTVGMVIGLVTYFFYKPSVSNEKNKGSLNFVQDKKNVRIAYSVIVSVFFSSVLLWISYEQQANALVHWVSTVPGDISVGWLQAIPPAVVIFGIPILNWVWGRQAGRYKEPDVFMKLFVGAVIISTSQVFISFFAFLYGGISPNKLTIAFYLIIWEVGDLFFTPAAMGLFSRFAPKKSGGLVMALWYATFFVGNIISGLIGTLWGVFSPELYWSIVAIVVSAGAVWVFFLKRFFRGKVLRCLQSAV